MNWKEPAVWSTLIALLALVLSQLPPLRELLKRAQIRISIPENFQLFHNLGNPHLIMFLDFHNTGGRTIAIDRLLCAIVDENNNIWILPAQSYIPRQPADQTGNSLPEFPVGRIVLKPEDRWYERTHFYQLWNDADEERAGEIILEIRNNIISKLPTSDGSPVEARPEIVNKAVEFFNRNFNFHKGNYHLLVIALLENNLPIAMRGYEFTLYENHIRTLKSYTDEYKYGAGIYYPIQDPMRYLWIRFRLINDEKYIEKIYNKIKNKI